MAHHSANTLTNQSAFPVRKIRSNIHEDFRPPRENQLRVEYLPLSSLKPAKRNPKRHQIDTVLAS
ncbi:MAG TPA: hypothetical protein VJ521_07015, partial [Acidobacteriota bacterium]|nr:hypothetical protein [Acidobacteriota bacterium]